MLTFHSLRNPDAFFFPNHANLNAGPNYCNKDITAIIHRGYCGKKSRDIYQLILTLSQKLVR